MINVDGKIAKLEKIVPILKKNVQNCTICPRKCLVNRANNEIGECGMSATPKIASMTLHHGEEPPISGTNGSGTIFLSGCNMHCIFCQNYPISQLKIGTEYTAEQIADEFINLQKRGAHNLNFVTPTHFSMIIMEALLIAYKNGLHLPILYNTNGYESTWVLNLLDGIIDIYLPDMKYSDDKYAQKYSDVPNYVAINRAAIKIMVNQVGIVPRFDKNGIMQKGIIIRHLVLPNNIENSIKVLEYIVDTFGNEIYLSIMNQYFPAYKAISDTTDINRKLTFSEWEEILATVDKLGISNGWIQEWNF